MPGSVFKYENLSSPEISSLDKKKTAVFLAVSPLEGHGPHLPVGVDLFDAVFFAESLAETIVERNPGYDAILFPPIPLGTQVYRQTGSVRIKPTVLYEIIMGIGESLVSSGFKYVFILSGHGSPKDIVAIESACIKVSKKHNVEMHNLSGALAFRFLKGEFNEEISGILEKPLADDEMSRLKKDIHGGWWETSMMLLLKPDLVKGSYKTLPDFEKTKDAKAEGPGYYGSPSLASTEFAKASLKVMTDDVLETTESCLNGNDIAGRTVSPLYKIRPLRPKFKRHLALAILIPIKSAVLIWLIYKYFIA